MSVLIADLEVFNYAAQGVKKMAKASLSADYDSPFFSKSAAEHFTGKNVSAESMRLFKSLIELTERSYDGHYNETPDQERLSSFIDFKSVEDINPVQLINYLFCIYYNIETEFCNPTPSEAKDHDLLKSLMFESRLYYLMSTPEWRAIPSFTFTGHSSDMDVYGYVYSGVTKVAFNNTCDAFYGYMAKTHFNDVDPCDEAKRLVKSWIDLSQLSTPITGKFSDSLRPSKVNTDSAVKLVRYLHSIRQDIGNVTSSFKGFQKDIQVLDTLILELTWSIIQNSPEFQRVKYSTL